MDGEAGEIDGMLGTPAAVRAPPSETTSSGPASSSASASASAVLAGDDLPPALAAALGRDERSLASVVLSPLSAAVVRA